MPHWKRGRQRRRRQEKGRQERGRQKRGRQKRGKQKGEAKKGKSYARQALSELETLTMARCIACCSGKNKGRDRDGGKRGCGLEKAEPHRTRGIWPGSLTAYCLGRYSACRFNNKKGNVEVAGKEGKERVAHASSKPRWTNGVKGKIGVIWEQDWDAGGGMHFDT